MSFAPSVDADPPAHSPDGRGAGRAVLSFIETQFPVSRLSKESYKERKANYSQTLTGLGKWWGRKPLVMVRGSFSGCSCPPRTTPARIGKSSLRSSPWTTRGSGNANAASFRSGRSGGCFPRANGSSGSIRT